MMHPRRYNQVKNFFIVVFVLFLFAMASVLFLPRLYLKSAHFRRLLQSELIFLTGADDLRIHIEKVYPYGIASVRLSKLTFFQNDQVLLATNQIFLSPRLRFFPPGVDYRFRTVIDKDRNFFGVYKVPLLGDLTLFKKRKDIDAVSGDLDLKFKNLPLQFLLGLWRGRFSPEISNNVSGDLTGSLKFVRKYPYKSFLTRASADFEVHNMQVRLLPLTRKQTAKTISLNPFHTRWLFSPGALYLREPVLLSSKEKRGKASFEGGLVILEGNEFEFALSLSGESDLFVFLKNFFVCPLNKSTVILRGFKKISCY